MVKSNLANRCLTLYFEHPNPHIIDNKSVDNYLRNIIDKLLKIYNLLRVTTKTNLFENKTNIQLNDIITFQSKFKIPVWHPPELLRGVEVEFSDRVAKIIFINKHELIKNMQDLHTIHWNWIDNNSIIFNRNKFINFCANIWKDNVTTMYSHIISFRHIYNKFKNLEKRIPCSYALILNKIRNKCLLIRHHNSDKWSLPGGKIEYKETHAETLKREIYEELGINIQVLRDNINNYKYHDKKIDKKHFRCYIMILNEKTRYQTQSPFEIAEIKWWLLSDLPKCTKLVNYIKKDIIPQCMDPNIIFR